MPIKNTVTRLSLSQSAVKTLWLAMVLIVLDQLTKYWANAVLVVGDPVAIMPNLNMSLIYNYGAAFSFLANSGGWQVWFFTALAALISMVLIVWLRKMPLEWSAEVVGINLIMSGAIGNAIDRLVAGKVTDFVDVYIGTWHYATFNVADIAISVGAGLILLSEFWIKPRQEAKKTKMQKNALLQKNNTFE